MRTDIAIPDGLALAAPSERLLDDYVKMVEFSLAAGETGDGYVLIDPAVPRRDPRAFLTSVRDMERGHNLPKNFVPMATRWLVNGAGEVVGETRIRSELTSALEVEGGHVGYFVHARHRGKGYGNAILALGLAELRRMGVRRVLVTCNADNERSRRIIERNGGVFRQYTTSPRSGKQVMTFWIENAG